MAILLSGGTGYIGSHTAVELMAKGREVILADNFSNSKERVPQQIGKITGHEPKLYKIDVADTAAVRKIFAENTIDAVIHFAGFKAVKESVDKPLKYYRNNLDTTLTLLEVMREFGCTRFVFSSSATVYGIPEKLPLTEDMATSAINPYGQTKIMIEQILRDVVAAAPEMSVMLLRYFNPVGAHESGLIGESPDGIPNNLMPYVAQVAAGKLKNLHIYGRDYPTPDGTGVRDYIHVVDLAKGHIAALDFGEKNRGIHIFNLGTGKPHSVLEMVWEFEMASGCTVPYVFEERRAGDVASCYAGVEKAARELSWTAEKTLRDMCVDTWRWQKNEDQDMRTDSGIQ